MCGRFGALDLVATEEVLGPILNDLLSSVKTLNKMVTIQGEVFPADNVPVVIGTEEKKLRVEAMFWGFPGFKNMLYKNRPPKLLINARSETADDLPTWKNALTSGRCLIPSSGFFEWAGVKKQKYLFRLDGEKVLFLAGIYQLFQNELKILPNRFAILTTSANSSISDIHKRMPVVIRLSEKDEWLFGDYKKLLDRNEILFTRKKSN
ncbi:MAG: SOS response-associated peptidase [Deltaproteobacteria bacterium]|jgi:putative SOS response-associated peptidase YedK|nr:SOS response-associated peptidase [Deltaproteobacteria bacterium]